MKILLLTMAVLLPAVIFILNRLVERYRNSGGDMVRLVIMMKDQEPWVEGFIRKLFRLAGKNPDLKIQVVDDGSGDLTGEVLARLQRIYAFELTRKPKDMAGETNPAGCYFFDVRGLRGFNLLKSPVFSQLKAFSAGKSPGLSK